MMSLLSVVYMESFTHQWISQQQQVNKNQPYKIISILNFHNSINR